MNDHAKLEIQTYGRYTVKPTVVTVSDKLDSNLSSVDGETDRRDSLLTNSIQNIGE